MLSWYLPLLIFILIAGFTPGPNNIIAMSIGFNFGFKRVIPHIFGVTIGFPIMLLLIGFIIKDFIQSQAFIFILLKVFSSIYLLYLSYKIATSSTSIETNSKQQPITFIESLAFQWINPKAWAGALATVTLYLPQQNYSYELIVATLTSLITIPFAISIWAIMGKKIKVYISKPKHIKAFNIIMALLLVVSVGAILI